MKQTMLLKLDPTEEHHQALLETMHAFNAACNYVAGVAFAEQTANKFELQKVVYRELRTTYKLASQLAIRAISKASEAYKRDKSIQPTFKPLGAIVYDERVMSFKGLTTVSLLTLQGRVLVPFRIGGYQQARMDRIKGQADLIYRNGTFYLAVTLDAPEPTPDAPQETLGIDLGIVSLATDSEGETFSGAQVEKNRQRYANLRQRLQKRATKSAKRHLKKLSGREARFRRNSNHIISKRIVQKAKVKKQGIAIIALISSAYLNYKDLRHIRTRTEARLRKSQRYSLNKRSLLELYRHSSWAFAQLREFLSYKAALAGVPLHTVDPRNTSRTCSACGHCAKANRKSQASFCCVNCGHSDNADLIARISEAYLSYNAAINISVAAVMQPIVWAGSRDGLSLGA